MAGVMRVKTMSEIEISRCPPPRSRILDLEIKIPMGLRVRFHTICNARIENVGKYQPCMVCK